MALGVLAFIVAGAAVYVLRRRRNTSGRQTESYRPELDAQSLATPHPNVPEYASSKQGWAEMPVDTRVYEKDSAPVATRTIGELEAPRY